VIEQPGELDAFVKRAAGGVAEGPQAPGRGQRVVLQRELLLPSGDAATVEPHVHRHVTVERFERRADVVVSQTPCEPRSTIASDLPGRRRAHTATRCPTLAS